MYQIGVDNFKVEYTVVGNIGENLNLEDVEISKALCYMYFGVKIMNECNRTQKTANRAGQENLAIWLWTIFCTLEE